MSKVEKWEDIATSIKNDVDNGCSISSLIQVLVTLDHAARKDERKKLTLARVEAAAKAKQECAEELNDIEWNLLNIGSLIKKWNGHAPKGIGG